MTRLPFDMGVAHYDEPPPDHVDDLDALREADRFRFANRLSAWIEVDGGRITGHGYSGGGQIGSTTMRLGGKVGDVRRGGLPRPAAGARGVGQLGALRADQRRANRRARAATRQVPAVRPGVGAAGVDHPGVDAVTPTAARRTRWWAQARSPAIGSTTTRASWCTSRDWSTSRTGTPGPSARTRPWGDEDSPALVSEVETALERELSGRIMRGGTKPRISRLSQGGTLVSEGDEGRDVFLVLDGVVSVEVKGTPLGQLGPGAVLGERALIEGGRRTATRARRHHVPGGHHQRRRPRPGDAHPAGRRAPARGGAALSRDLSRSAALHRRR